MEKRYKRLYQMCIDIIDEALMISKSKVLSI